MRIENKIFATEKQKALHIFMEGFLFLIETL